MAKCKGKTQLGRRCGAFALKDGAYCIAHVDRETQEKVGFGGAQPGAGRPRLPKPHERMRERIEENIDALLEPYFSAITEAVVVVKYEGEATVSDIADYGARIAAVEKLLDRVYGKPAQALELSGGADVSIEAGIIGVDTSEMADAAHEFLRHLLPKQ